jgi:hypothetical protein
MKVQELMERLLDFEPTAEVVIWKQPPHSAAAHVVMGVASSVRPCNAEELIKEKVIDFPGLATMETFRNTIISEAPAVPAVLIS